jgi:hypothetical protein
MPGFPDNNHTIIEYAHDDGLQSRKSMREPSKIDTVT